MDIVLVYRKTKSDGVANMLRTLGNFSREGRKTMEVNITTWGGTEGGKLVKSGNLFPYNNESPSFKAANCQLISLSAVFTVSFWARPEFAASSNARIMNRPPKKALLIGIILTSSFTENFGTKPLPAELNRRRTAKGETHPN